MGLLGGTALTVASVVGTGVLVLPALAVRQAGPAALVAVVALVVLSVPLAVTFAALGVRYPSGGGISTFVRHAVGPGASTVTAWWFYFGVPLGVPALGLFAGDYVASVTGGGSATRTATAAVLVLAAAAANARGVRVSGAVQVLLTGVLVTSLVAVLALVAPAADVQRLAPFAPHGWGAVAPASVLLVWLLTGWESAAHLTGRFRNPARDVPRATVATLVVVAVLFGGLTLALVTVDTSPAGHGEHGGTAPVALLLDSRFAGGGGAAAAVLAVLVTLGNANAYLAGLAELGAQMGRCGSAPHWLAAESSADLPRRSLSVVVGQALFALVLVAALGCSAEQLVLLTSASQVAVYAAGLLAALRLLPRGTREWWCAALSLPPIAALGVLSGWYLLAPLSLGLAALAYHRITTSRRIFASRAARPAGVVARHPDAGCTRSGPAAPGDGPCGAAPRQRGEEAGCPGEPAPSSRLDGGAPAPARTPPATD